MQIYIKLKNKARKLVTGNVRQISSKWKNGSETNKLNVPFMKITMLIFSLSTNLHHTSYPFPLQVPHYFKAFI